MKGEENLVFNDRRWKLILEALDEVSDEAKSAADESIENEPIEADGSPIEDEDSSDDESMNDSSEYGISDNNIDDSDLIAELKKIYTPVLIMQNYQTESCANKIHESLSRSGLLTESNVMKFDNETKRSQLLSVCALLIARKKNTSEYQAFKKAAKLQKEMKLAIQKNEAGAAKALAQKFLTQMSGDSDNEDAKEAALKMLSSIQH